jgi:hypothetical protein
MSAENEQGAGARERKRARFEESPAASNRKRSALLAVGVAAVIVAVSAFFLLRGGDTNTSVARDPSAPPTMAAPGAPGPAAPSGASVAAAAPISPEGDVFRIPASAVTAEASFFKASEGSTTVPFFAVRDSAGRVHVALDACQVCAAAKKGYVQQGDQMTCRNCGQSFAIAQITAMGGKGGCHPISLPSTASGDSIVVKRADVAAGAKWF